MSPEPIDGRDDQESILLLADEQQVCGRVALDAGTTG